MSDLVIEARKKETWAAVARKKGTLAGLEPHSKRELPPELENWRQEQEVSLKQVKENFEKERSELIEQVEETRGRIARLKTAYENAKTKADKWRAALGTPFVANYLIWAGVTNIFALSALVNLLRKDNIELRAAIQILMDLSENLLKSDPPDKIVLAILALIIIVTHVLTAVSKSKSKVSIAVEAAAKPTQIFATIGISVGALRVSGDAISDDGSAVLAAIFGIPSLVFQALVFLKAAQSENTLAAYLADRKSIIRIAFISGAAIFALLLAAAILSRSEFWLLRLMLLISFVSSFGPAPGLILKGLYWQESFKEAKVQHGVQALEELQKKMTQLVQKFEQDKKRWSDDRLDVENAFFSAYDSASRLSEFKHKNQNY